MNTVEELAGQILERTEKLQVANPVEMESQKAPDGSIIRGFGVLTVITIISIVIQLVKLYKSCKQTPDQVVSSFQHDGFMHRAALRRAIRKGLKDNNLPKGHLENIEQATKDVGFNLKTEDIEKLYAEVQ